VTIEWPLLLITARSVSAGLLSRVDAALVALVTDPVHGMPAVRAAVDLLTDALLSRLSYEERHILEPWPGSGPGSTADRPRHADLSGP
jgi:hypothetical protein